MSTKRTLAIATLAAALVGFGVTVLLRQWDSSNAAEGEAADMPSMPPSPSGEKKKQRKISQLFVYPVKSMRGVSLKSATLEKEGLKYDRRWVVVDHRGTFLSQRTHGQLAMLSARVVQDPNGKDILEIQSEVTKESILVPIDVSEAARRKEKIRIWDDEVHGAYDQGDAIAVWLEKKLVKPDIRLVYMGADCERPISEKYRLTDQDRTAFNDGFPMLVLSQASLNDLNRRIFVSAKEKGETPKHYSVARFRPNIVLSGCEPFEEDTFTSVTIGGKGVTLRVVKPCPRCKMTTIDPKTGKGGLLTMEPYVTLASYRSRDENVYFGQNTIWDESVKVHGPPEIFVGDTYTMEQDKSKRI
eukprot:CAMPEP_0184561192 /NCGR_PEP_ID=MMETSP0199_2-20130426/47314_1 /TAXON_ID=1112570 /ORGANISM="Thraustochytrium sp., Strain LLF1b" /LENGTH=356 /DNA_ID=CAMNT_0026958503 /DNA_START=23 /DNA_END=1093 /DNA_ORIENTATION=-